ncbi:MAG TPA: hypothetical protein VGJ13_15160 [Pseudonocardiaceae bacterium]
MAVPATGPPAVRPLCTPTDPGLAELSGLASDGQRWYAVSDGGTRLRVLVLDPADCTVLDRITAEVDPYDVEDLALARDGALWLADTGDNDLKRSTVALHRLAPDGGARLYRLTYPDGPHDTEALLLDHTGVPYLVTKELGVARVYRPSGGLAEPGPTPLARVGTVRIEPTSTPGGPVGTVGSVLITGGAVSSDGLVVALRTYTDAYLFSAPGGDVLAGLATTPVRIPLPGEPQGEAVALTPDGTLLSGSEELSGSAALSGSDVPAPVQRHPPIRGVSGVVELVAPVTPVRPPAAGPARTPAAPVTHSDDDGLSPGTTALVVLGLAGLLALLAARRRSRAR